jgi:hypothetical protein
MMLKNALLRRSRNALWLAVALAAGCNASHVLGEVDASPPRSTGAAGTGGSMGTPAAGSGGGVVASDAGSPLPDAPAEPEVAPFGPSESWTGYIENFTFPSGSDAIKLTFATDANGVIGDGTITFGKGTPPPPATDPSIGYPPSLFPPGSNTVVTSASASMLVFEGYTYALEQASISAHRFKGTFSIHEPWSTWCALQTPPQQAADGMCLPNYSAGETPTGCVINTPGAETVVDCGRWSLCRFISVCTCSATACSTSDDSGTLDIFLETDTASGSVSLSGPQNVHFTKD